MWKWHSIELENASHTMNKFLYVSISNSLSRWMSKVLGPSLKFSGGLTKLGLNFLVTRPQNNKPVTLWLKFWSTSWWRHQMETFSALLAICAGNSPVPGEFPTQRPVTRSFDVYFDLRPNKWLSKQSWGWWFETLSCSLWRHRNVHWPSLITVHTEMVCK